LNKPLTSGSLLLALSLGLAESASAHPGHGDETTLLGLLHMLEPVHLLPALAGVGVAALLRRAARRRSDERRHSRADQDKPSH
jgi:hydrogenase/urease accessory protein HupE